MRILIVNYEFPPLGAGGGNASSKIAECLVDMGHSVRVITSRPVQLYTLMGNIALLAGAGFWLYLAYWKLQDRVDISDHGFTQLGTTLLLAGFILRTMGLVWELVMPFRDLKATEFIEGVEVHRVPVLRKRQDYCSTPEMATFMLSGAFYSMGEVRDFKPDLVHVFFGIPDGPIGWVLKRAYGLPYIISLRGADVPSDQVKRFAKQYKVLRPFIRHLWYDADAVVAVSNGLRGYALQTTPDLDIEVIPNAIDLSIYRPPERHGTKDGPVRLLYVGRFNAFKNVETLIEAAALLEEKHAADFELRLIGEGERRPALEQMVKDRGLARRVRFLGWLERADVVEHYRQADVFVTATTWEGMPNTVLEAMACGTPIVGTRTSGLHELVRDGINGYLVPQKDPDALAEKIRLLLENGYERERMGRQSRKIAEREFAWEQITKGYLKIYERALSESAESGAGSSSTGSSAVSSTGSSV